jgi:hypothetical protein
MGMMDRISGIFGGQERKEHIRLMDSKVHKALEQAIKADKKGEEYDYDSVLTDLRHDAKEYGFKDIRKYIDHTFEEVSLNNRVYDGCYGMGDMNNEIFYGDCLQTVAAISSNMVSKECPYSESGKGQLVNVVA